MGVIKTGKIQSHGNFNELDDRITVLEDTYVRYLWFAEISSGTSGTITPPTGGAIVLDQWAAGVDAVTSTLTTTRNPTFESVKEADGTIITATLAANGAWTISGTPSAYPIAILYVYEVKLISADRTKCLVEIETDQGLKKTDSPTFADITDSGLSASLVVVSDANKKLISGTNTDAQMASAVSASHTRSHAITGTSDHTSSATSGQMLKADASGLPIDATNTDADVASAVSLKHTQGTDTALGTVGTKNPPIDADLALYRDSAAGNVLVTSTWTQVKAFLKTYFDAIYHIVGGALGTPSSGTLTSCTGLPQAGVVGLTTADSPVFVTVKLSGLTDLKIPKHVADATGLADTTITVSANNEVTNASQPSFLARPTATLTNVTGDGTVYTVVFATEVFDQNADFDGTSTFTAPVAGRYLLSFNLFIEGLVAGHNEHQTGLVASNRGFWYNWNFAAGANPFTYGERGHTVLVDMDAADTVYVTYAVTGGALAVDLSTQSYFSGHLVC